MKVYNDLFNRITSLENIITAWDEFRSDKGDKADVQTFEFSLERNLFALHHDLTARRYVHGPYAGFYIRDPKVRHIHKATVRDRVLHHAIFRILNPIFEPTFIADSFSCRIGKGAHRGVSAVETMIRRESRNFTTKCFALKCDVRKFFDSVDHDVLLTILSKRIADPNVVWLLERVVRSFTTSETLFNNHGLPIGNLTSQLFANIYMNEFDQFVKHQLKIRHYARYTDDFVIISRDEQFLKNILGPCEAFLREKLRLSLHPKKILIRTVERGIDFLGYIVLPHHRLLRTKTKHRIFRKLYLKIEQRRHGVVDDQSFQQSLQSYLGVLSHANTHRLSEEIKNQCWYWLCN